MKWLITLIVAVFLSLDSAAAAFFLTPRSTEPMTLVEELDMAWPQVLA
ncbi:hypothetical protein [Pseudomonas sp. dw_358]|nr:hypothetical protein [Pseudomonas sp. dw_358]